MLRDPIMSLSVTYIEGAPLQVTKGDVFLDFKHNDQLHAGSALIDKDLQRAHVGSALAIFIMANKFR